MKTELTHEMGAQEIILGQKGGERLLSLLHWEIKKTAKKKNKKKTNKTKKKQTNQETIQYTKRIQSATFKTLSFRNWNYYMAIYNIPH